MFSVTVSDHILVAHSLKGEVFGPARKVHGCTFVVEAEFRAARLDENGIVLDIGLARQVLREILSDLDYCNLDDHPDFKGRNSTTEALAQAIFQRLAAKVHAGAFGNAQEPPESLKITLRESPVAWASFEGRLD